MPPRPPPRHHRAADQPRVTATVTSAWLRALPDGRPYEVPVGASWKVSYTLADGTGAVYFLRGQRLPGDLTAAAFFAQVPHRAGRYYFAPVDALGRRFVDTRLAYVDVAPHDATVAAPARPRRGLRRRPT